MKDKKHGAGSGLVATVVSLLYPPTCPVCGTIRQKNEACFQCEKKLKYITEPRCKKCSKHILMEEMEYCMDCGRREHGYESGIALYAYQDYVKELIMKYKYHNRREYGEWLAQQMIRYLGDKWKEWDCDVIMPIPVHKKKRVKRGFNQTEIMAERIAEYLRVPCVANLLERTVNTTPQKEFSPEERRKNLKNAFKISENIVKYKKVLLVDDIYTTGSTIDSCAEVLKEHGVRKVYFTTASIGNGM